MTQFPQLYGEHGWTMVYRIDTNTTKRINGPMLCLHYFGGIARAIEAFARGFS